MPNRILASAMAILLAACAHMSGDEPATDTSGLRVVSDTTVGGFTFPESVGCDAAQKVLYVSNFGGTELKSGEKDGKGFIMKVALDGKVIEQRAFDVTMNKPKGIWVQGARLWVTDIDSVWIFDTKTKQGRRLPIPGAVFANDPAVAGGVLYVSDNRSDQLFAIEPADFLDAGVRPKVTALWKGKEINPNGLWPARDGSLLMVGLGGGKPRGIYSMAKGADQALSQAHRQPRRNTSCATARSLPPTGSRALSSAGARRTG
jgi:hypothetical protein